MNLIYVWIENCRDIRKKGIRLNHNYEIEINGDITEVSPKNTPHIPISITKKANIPDSIYKNKNIIDTYLVLGKNGSGKTTLLDIISDFINDAEYYILFSLTHIDGNEYYYIKKKNKFSKPFIFPLNATIFPFSTIKHSEPGCLILKNADIFKINDFFNNNNNVFNPFSATKSNKIKNLRIEPILDFICENHDTFLSFKKHKTFTLTFNLDINQHDFSTKNNISNFDLCMKYSYLSYYTNKIKKITVIESLNQIDENNIEFQNINTFYSKEYNRLMEKCVELNFKDFTLEVKSFYNLFSEKWLSFLNTYDDKKYSDLNSSPIEKQNLDSFHEIIIHFHKTFRGTGFFKSEISQLSFTLENLLNIYNTKKYKEYIDAISSLIQFPEVDYDFNVKFNFGTSSGEEHFLSTLARVNNDIKIIKDLQLPTSIIYYLFDEVEIYLHPEWCRKIYQYIYNLINKIETKHKFYVYITTHSPYIISDFMTDHVINLEPQNTEINFKSFGANIYDIMKKGMFLKHHIGEFALDKIRKVHQALIKESTEEKIIEATGMQSITDLANFIDNIGDTMIKMQLKHLYQTKIHKRDFDLSTLERIKEIAEKDPEFNKKLVENNIKLD